MIQHKNLIQINAFHYSIHHHPPPPPPLPTFSSLSYLESRINLLKGHHLCTLSTFTVYIHSFTHSFFYSFISFFTNLLKSKFIHIIIMETWLLVLYHTCVSYSPFLILFFKNIFIEPQALFSTACACVQ